MIGVSGSMGSSTDADPSCGEYATQADAQAAYDEDQFENYQLDQDFDGEACEDFFGAPAASPAPSTDPFVPFAAVQRLTDEQNKTVSDAKERAVASCMASRGFTYQPQPYQAATPGKTWGNVDHARRYGYGLNLGNVPDGDQDENQQSSPAPDQTVTMSEGEKEAWNKALQGPAAHADATGHDPDLVAVRQGDATVYFSKSACRTYGNEQVEGDAVAWQTAQGRFEDLANEVTRRVDADPRTIASMQKWSECMKGRGYDFPSPDQSATYAHDQVQNHQITEAAGRQLEIQVAVADAECANSSGALDGRRQVAAETEAAVRRDHENDFLAFAELQRKAVERANAQAGSR